MLSHPLVLVATQPLAQAIEVDVAHGAGAFAGRQKRILIACFVAEADSARRHLTVLTGFLFLLVFKVLLLSRAGLVKGCIINSVIFVVVFDILFLARDHLCQCDAFTDGDTSAGTNGLSLLVFFELADFYLTKTHLSVVIRALICSDRIRLQMLNLNVDDFHDYSTELNLLTALQIESITSDLWEAYPVNFLTVFIHLAFLLLRGIIVSQTRAMLIVLYFSDDEPQLAHFALRCRHGLLIFLVEQDGLARPHRGKHVVPLMVNRVDTSTVSAVLLLQALTMNIACLLVGHAFLGRLRLSELAEIDKEQSVLVQFFLQESLRSL